MKINKGDIFIDKFAHVLYQIRSIEDKALSYTNWWQEVSTTSNGEKYFTWNYMPRTEWIEINQFQYKLSGILEPTDEWKVIDHRVIHKQYLFQLMDKVLLRKP